MDDESIKYDVELPGFRFHPTEEELLQFYLKNMLLGRKLQFEIIGILNIYHHDPWDLPGLAKIGEREWYFFVPRNRDRKHGNGGRPNRTTKKGFWKATGSDRKILSLSNPKKMIGLKKTLVFYTGRAPRGCKTDWVMNEYRLPDADTDNAMVLCKIYRKATSLRELEQRAAKDQGEMKATYDDHHDPYSYYSGGPSPSPPMDAVSICNHNIQQHDQMSSAITSTHKVAMKKEDDQEVSGLLLLDQDEDDEQEHVSNYNKACTTNTSLRLGTTTNLTQLQVPKLNMDWTQDPFWTQLRSPWLDNFTPPYYNYYANVLNF